jgi:predicted Fe-Mo cluster-binding NifX family protein
MADLMKELNVDAVIAGNMGGEGKAALLSYGIVPIVGYSGDADTASDLLVTGQLPTSPADGGCGGCSGNCGCGHEEGCGCGGAEGGCSCGC